MAYLTVVEYVARFGAAETRLFTNLDNTAPIAPPGYDAAKVDTALDDATEEVEGYIARRYKTPLAQPPKIVKGWVAAIARLKLAEATGRVSDVIKDGADRVTRQLEQLVVSKLDLPIDPGDPVPSQIGGGSVTTSGDAAPSEFGPAGVALDSFLAPWRGYGNGAPRWTQ